MYYAVRASAPSLHRESTDSLIITSSNNKIKLCISMSVHLTVFSKQQQLLLYIQLYEFYRSILSILQLTHSNLQIISGRSRELFYEIWRIVE